jgi:alkaline phosphatase D
MSRYQPAEPSSPAPSPRSTGACGSLTPKYLAPGSRRTDLQNLPAEGGPRWPADGFALAGGEDWTGYRTERAEILDFVERERISGFATVAGDRHSFVAGVLSKSLPPHSYKPVAAEFITGSVSAPTLFEGAQHNLKPDQPWRAVYLHDLAAGARPEPAINLSIRHGVRASLALQKTGDLRQALAAANPEVAPHLSFVDLGGHGYAVVGRAPRICRSSSSASRGLSNGATAPTAARSPTGSRTG